MPYTSVALCMRNAIMREGLERILKSKTCRVQASVSNISELSSPKLDADTSFVALLADDETDLLEEEALAEFAERFPDSSVVLLVDRWDEDKFRRYERMGLSIILNSISSEALITSLRLISLGERVYSKGRSELSCQDIRIRRLEQMAVKSVSTFDCDDTLNYALTSSVVSHTTERIPLRSKRSELSERELQILNCLVAGQSNKVIARACKITEATVKVHLKAILRKTDVVNRTQAAIWALQNLTHGDVSAVSRPAFEEPQLERGVA